MRSRQPRVVLPTGELRHLGGLRLRGDEASREVRFNDEATVAGRLVGAAGAWVGLSLLCLLASTGRVPWASFFTTSLEPSIAETQAWLREGPEVRRAMLGSRAAPARDSRTEPGARPLEPHQAPPSQALNAGLAVSATPVAGVAVAGVLGETPVVVAGLPPVPNPRIDFGRFHSAGNRRVEALAPVSDWALSDRELTDKAPMPERAASGSGPAADRGLSGQASTTERVSLDRAQLRVEAKRAQLPLLAPVDDGSVALVAGLGLSGSGSSSKFAPVPLDGSWGDLALSTRRDVRPEARPDPATEPAAPPSSSRVSSGKSCEAAYAASVRDVSIGKSAGPDIAPRQYANLLEKEPFAGCGVARAARIEICVAVQQGKAVGVTVNTTPGDAALSRCVASRLRGLSFPSSAELDVVRTTLTFSSR